MYPLKGDRLQVSEVVYSVVSFYKEVTGHSFSYYLCKFWILFIFREYRRSTTLISCQKLSWWQQRKFNTSNLLLWQWTTSYCETLNLKDSFLCHPRNGEKRVSKRSFILGYADVTVVAQNELRLDGAFHFTKQMTQCIMPFK